MFEKNELRTKREEVIGNGENNTGRMFKICAVLQILLE
jgi:hypothetical protein